LKSPQDVSDDRKSAPASGLARSGGVQMASSGFDLAVVICGFTAIGWWLDRKYGWAPWGVLTGAILGIVGGLTNFLRAATAQMRSIAAEEKAEHEPGAKGGTRDGD
jgi:F0F1-type ATP synthase assembly protein I